MTVFRIPIEISAPDKRYGRSARTYPSLNAAMDAEGIFPSDKESRVPLIVNGNDQQWAKQSDVFSASESDPLCPSDWMGTQKSSCFKVYQEKVTNDQVRSFLKPFSLFLILFFA